MRNRNICILFLVFVAILFAVGILYLLPIATPSRPDSVPEQSELKRGIQENKSVLKPVAQSKLQPSSTSSNSKPLTGGFSNTLREIRTICSQAENARAVEQDVLLVASTYLEEARGNEDMIADALRRREGPPQYTVVLLALAYFLDVPDRQDLAWELALNSESDPMVVRNAAALLGRIPSTRRRPKDFLRVLEKADPLGKSVLLRVAPYHMDDEGYKQVKRMTANEETDVNVRLAAVNAVDAAERPDRRPSLQNLVDRMPTSARTTFSEDSLVKRRALEKLDMRIPANYERARSLAADISEDRGVRRKAILKVAEIDTPETKRFLTDIFVNLKDDEILLVKGAAEALVALEDEAALRLVEDRAARSDNPDLKSIIEAVLEGGPRGGAR